MTNGLCLWLPQHPRLCVGPSKVVIIIVVIVIRRRPTTCQILSFQYMMFCSDLFGYQFGHLKSVAGKVAFWAASDPIPLGQFFFFWSNMGFLGRSRRVDNCWRLILLSYSLNLQAISVWIPQSLQSARDGGSKIWVKKLDTLMIEIGWRP